MLLVMLLLTMISDYPDFYAKLYALLQPSILLARHRARFFSLAHLFLTSTCVLMRLFVFLFL